MPNYRRAFAPGVCRFFTVNLLDRRRGLLTDNIGALREATRLTQTRHPFTIDAMVVLPDHVHAVWTLPPGDTESFVALAADQNRLHQGRSQDRTANAMERRNALTAPYRLPARRLRRMRIHTVQSVWSWLPGPTVDTTGTRSNASSVVSMKPIRE
jgi:REP element-mobilizing transposase RayT